ncbi:MAG: hypothetical protein WD766_08770 [Gemmatimonadota bacterium]
MPAIAFPKLPDHARIWIFGTSEPLEEEPAARLGAAVARFIDGWEAHGQPVVGSFDWRERRFLIVAADELATGVSGCSIDSLFRTLQPLERELGTTLLDRSLVWYRDGTGAVRSSTRPEFRELVRRGVVDDRTTVFDNTAATVGTLRGGEWERPLADSWHAEAFLAPR